MFGNFYVSAFLRFCVIIIIEIVDKTIVMVPYCTAELNTLMNELEMSELEVSFKTVLKKCFVGYGAGLYSIFLRAYI